MLTGGILFTSANFQPKTTTPRFGLGSLKKSTTQITINYYSLTEDLQDV